jgi:hypothetical protein
LTITQRIQWPALRVGLGDLECQIERAARRKHAQVLVKDKKRLSDGVHDRLSKGTGILVFDEWLDVP